MQTVKFNEIKGQFTRITVLYRNHDHVDYFVKDANGKYIPMFGPVIADPNILVNAVSVLDPDVTICETDEEYGVNQGHFKYRPTQMYGFKVGNDGMVDFIDDDKTVTFYFK